MNHYPDFSAHGFQIVRELGRNPGGGRVTYLAHLTDRSDNRVVVKQFQFAKTTTWDGHKAIARETKALKDLKHPGIPRYLSSFETEDSVCIVQEYKEAEPLSTPRSFTPDQIKQIATALLEILVYLQDRIPQVFHRDIKPENVLVSDDLQVYLIDFGFARIGGNDLAMSSVVAGTFGFMPPEQIRNLQLTPASDLYGLGLTLVCVIANLRSQQIGEYVDFSNQLDQKAIEAKLKGCSFRFIDWLNHMVAPDPKKRFPDATTALEALKPLYVKRTPQVSLDHSSLDFQATKVGEKLSQTITVTNTIPETVLEGYWEVAPHPNDPPHTPHSHSWIFISPQKVQGNHVTCTVTVDTSQLKTESQGSRQLVFHSNAEQNQVTVPLQIKTASNLTRLPRSLYLREALFSGIILLDGCLLSSGLILAFQLGGLAVVGVFVVILAMVGAWAWAEARSLAGAGAVAMVGAWAVVMFFVLAVVGGRAGAVAGAWAVAGARSLAGAVAGAWAMNIAISSLDENYKTLPPHEHRHAWTRFWIRIFMALLSGGSIGAGLVAGFTAHFLIPVGILGTGAGLVYASIAPMLTRRRQLAAQRRQEHLLIAP